MVIIEQVLDDLAHAVPFLAVQAGELFVRQREGSAVHAARREVVRVEMREGKVLERHEHHLRDLGAGRERGHAVPAHEKDKRKLVVKAAVRADIALAEAAAGRDIGFVRVQSDLLACLAQRGGERRFAGVHVAGRGQVVEAGIERPVVLPFLQPDAAHAVTHAHDPQMADMVAQTLRVDDAARTRYD